MIRMLMRARRASVAVYAGVMLPILAGMAGLGGEYAYGLMTQATNQRIADAAAYAGALAYNSTSSTTSMNAAVSQVATLNGIASTAAVASLVNSPTGDGNQAVQVVVTTTQNLTFSRLISSTSSLTIAATAYVEFSSSSPGCILALSSTSTGVTLSGGTTLQAPGCSVASNNTVTVPCGTSIVTATLKYNSAAAPSIGCNGVTAPSGKSLTISKAATADWLAGNSAVTQAASNYTTVHAMTAPTGPTVTGGTNLNFSYSTGSGTPTSQMPAGCTATFSSPTWTVTCAAGGNYTFGSITLGGGITVNWATAGSSTNTYNFSGLVNVSGSAMTFGPGTYNMAGGLATGGGSNTTFAAGTYKIGRNTSSCSGDTYSICHTGSSLSFAGPVNMTLSNGISSGSTTVTIGSGSTANSYTLGGSATNNQVVNVGGGGNLVLGDSSTGSGSFSAVGNISTGGGSCLTLPATATHNIKGYVSSAGGLTLGAGVYTIDGYFALGANGGGSVTCGGTSIGLKASSVSLQVSGSSTASGSCAGYAFCVAAGFTNVTLTAPSTGASTGFAVIGPQSSSNTGGALFTQGASGVSLSGVFYVPYGPVQLSGGASVGNGTGQCLELIGRNITLTGGTALASTCAGFGGSNLGGSGSGTTLALVN